MNSMFYAGKTSNITDWTPLDTSSVTDMGGMFYGADVLAPINLILGPQVTSVAQTFRNVTINDLTGINTTGLTTMNSMFYAGKTGNITDWTTLDTSSVTDMGSMFYSAERVSSIGVFDISNVTNMKLMFLNIGFKTSYDYDDTLIQWAAKPHQNNVHVHFGDSTYTSAAATARGDLLADGWTIIDDGLVVVTVDGVTNGIVINILVGETETSSSEVTYSEGTGTGEMTYVSGASGIATVDTNGLVTGVSAGTATIIATSVEDGTFQGTTIVNIT